MTKNTTIPVTDFQIGIAGAGKSLSNNNELDIIFAGTGAMTNGSKMFLPALDQTKSVTQEQALVTRGLVIHESSHNERGDGKAWNKYGETANALAMGLLNSIEDVRLDMGSIELLAGAKPALTATCEHMFADVVASHPKGSEDWSDLGMLPITVAVLGRKKAGIDAPVLDSILDCVPPAVREVAEGITKEALTFHRDKRGTKQSIGLVREFIDDLAKKMEAEQKKSPGKSKGEGGADSSAGPGDATGTTPGDKSEPSKAGANSESSSAGTKYEAQASTQSGATSDEPGSGTSPGECGKPEGEYDAVGKDGEHVVHDSMPAGGGKGAGIGTSETGEDVISASVADDAPPSVAEELAKIVPVEANLDIASVLGDVMVGGHTAYVAASTAYDTVWSRKQRVSRGWVRNLNDRAVRAIDALESSPRGMEAYNTHRNNVKGHLGVCQRVLENALRSLNRRDWEGGKTQGRLDSRAFTQIVSSLTPYAFKDRSVGRELNTAVQIVVDLSGSMSGTKVRTARDTVIVLCEVFNRLDIPFEVVGFNSVTWAHNMSGVYDAVAYGTSGSLGAGSKDVALRAKEMLTAGAQAVRIDPLDIWVFKDFDDQLRYAQAAIGRMERFAGGNNMDGESIAVCASRLVVRREKRRIMMVLSDGSPAGYTVGPRAQQGLFQHLEDTVKGLERKQIEVIGIGIEDRSVAQFYPKHVVIDDVSELGGTVMLELGRMLVGRRFSIVGEHAA